MITSQTVLEYIVISFIPKKPTSFYGMESILHDGP